MPTPDPQTRSAAKVGNGSHFDWALCDPDAPPGTTYREGVGFESLVEALRDLCASEAERTPEQFIPSGNVSLYWSRKLRGSEWVDPLTMTEDIEHYP